MVNEDSKQPSNTDQKPLKNEKIHKIGPFGERVENTGDSGPNQPDTTDRYGELVYRDHDEFGEWLDRYN